MVNIILLGAGWHGKELYAYLKDIENLNNKIRFYGFIDDSKNISNIDGISFIGNFDDLNKHLIENKYEKFYYVAAVGNNDTRKLFVERIEAMGLDNIKPYILIHPTAYIGKNIFIDDGSCFAPHTIATTNIKIGKHCIINVKASISHNCSIGDYTSINPGVNICGDVTIGSNCVIGAGATLRDKIKIGNNVIIGAGAVAVNDIADDITAVGLPAKPVILRKKVDNVQDA